MTQPFYNARKDHPLAARALLKKRGKTRLSYVSCNHRKQRANHLRGKYRKQLKVAHIFFLYTMSPMLNVKTDKPCYK